jgi:hypothetical protein
MSITGIVSIANAISAVTAIGAAVLWFMSARVPIPQPTIELFLDTGGHIAKDDPFFKALEKSATWNKRAAAAAGVPALCMACALWLQIASSAHAH